jgi:hypothetical protein
MGGRGNESFLACTGVYLVHFPCKELLLSIASLPAISFSSSLATLNQIPCKKKKKRKIPCGMELNSSPEPCRVAFLGEQIHGAGIKLAAWQVGSRCIMPTRVTLFSG